jgi:hypothetical protein
MHTGALNRRVQKQNTKNQQNKQVYTNNYTNNKQKEQAIK